MATSAPLQMLDDDDLKVELQRLRRTDNVTNWFHIAKVYSVMAIAMAAAIAFHHWQSTHGKKFAWNFPVAYLAIIVIGASQHQLGGATHEATHFILFRNRRLNELVSDWLCMFPVFSTTYSYRIYHLSHHQYINDPERDPDFASLRMTGHWLGFPTSKLRFFLMLAKQFLVYPLIIYSFVRARFNSYGVTQNPYNITDRAFSKRPLFIGLVFLLTFVPTMIVASLLDARLVLAIAPPATLAIVTSLLMMIPADRYYTTKLRPVISPRATWISRIAFLTLLTTSLAWTQALTGAPAWIWYFVLWLVPLGGPFPFFLMMRQVVQHGNGDRGRMTNTRTFVVNRFIRYAVFPFGMDLHLTHHLFCTVPHYRLRELHAFLQRYPEYTQQGQVVEGYFFPPRRGADRNPTVVEVLGPRYSCRGEDVFIDDSAVEDCGA